MLIMTRRLLCFQQMFITPFNILTPIIFNNYRFVSYNKIDNNF